jgi:phosphopantothenoylcysteine decarboxylase
MQLGTSEACHGFADDALTSIVLATEAPLLLALAMNGKMWMAPRDGCKRRNPQTTRRQFHGPGKGRLWPVDAIVAKALEYKKR